jgi:nucleotide-binding universal stress UspA family protein
MFHRILVALDTSKAGKSVFEEALALAKANGANLMLLHVLCPNEEGCPDISGLLNTYYYPGTDTDAKDHCQQLWEQFSQKCLEMLRSRAEQAIGAGMDTEFAQRSGHSGRTICEVARTWEADLIVIGRRGHSGLENLVLGSVSNYVLHHAPCSVLTVQFPLRTDDQPASSSGQSRAVA